ncbi:MAG: hypothetical protein WC756_03055 [Taibaiella sp.]|jgi:hypothetical protein
MKKAGLLLAIAITYIPVVQAQVRIKQKGEHSINLSFTPQVYFNKVNSVDHTGEDRGQHVIYPKNTIGYNFGIEYQRITRYGLVFSIGMQTGIQKHDVGVHYNMGFVDDKVPELKNLTVDTQYAATLPHVGLRIMAGYRWQLSSGLLKGWDILAKGGATLKQYTTSLASTSQLRRVSYSKNDTLWIMPVGYDNSYFGSGSFYGSGIHTGLNLTLGISKKINCGFVKSVSISLDGTYGLFNVQGGSVDETLDKYNSSTGMLLNRASYNYDPKDFAVGIRFAVGLWPNIKSQR